MTAYSEKRGKLGKPQTLKLYDALNKKVTEDAKKQGVSWSEMIRRVLEDHYGMPTEREHKTVPTVEKLREEVKELKDQVAKLGRGKRTRRKTN